MGSKDSTDNGFAWALAFCAFLCNMLTAINIVSFGVFLTHIAEHFQVPLTLLGILAAIRTGLVYCTGVVSGSLIHRFSTRPVFFVGSLLGTIGYICGAYVDNFGVLSATFGILTGIGAGLQYLAPVVIIAQYFKKKRVLANGISSAGLSTGSALCGLTFGWIIHEITWRNTMILMAALNIQILVAAAFFFERKFDKPKLDIIKSTNVDTPNGKQDTQSTCSKCCQIFSNYVIDFRLLQNKSLALFTFINILSFSSGVSFYQLGPNRAYDQGVDRTASNYLTSAIGCCSFLGRLTCGFLGQHKLVSTNIYYAVATSAAGIISMLSVLAQGSLALQIIFAAIFGYLMGNFEGISPMVVLDLAGLENLSKGLGLQQGARGLCSYISLSLAGWLYDVSGGYLVPFLYLGSMTLLGGILTFFVSCIKRTENCIIEETAVS